MGDWELLYSQRDQFSTSLAACFSKSNQTWELSQRAFAIHGIASPGMNHWWLILPGLWTLGSPCSGVAELGTQCWSQVQKLALTLWHPAGTTISPLKAQNCITGRLIMLLKNGSQVTPIKGVWWKFTSMYVAQCFFWGAGKIKKWLHNVEGSPKRRLLFFWG